MALVVDDFIDEATCASLLQELHDEPCQSLLVPLSLEQQLQQLLRPGATAPASFEEKVLLPARLAAGNVGMHQDCLNPLDATDPGFIEGHIAILYLQGNGSFILQSPDVEQVVAIQPRRLVLWRNSHCLHGVKAPADATRAMLGPMTIDADGWLQRAHDIHSLHAADYWCRKQIEVAEVPRKPKQKTDAGARNGLESIKNFDTGSERSERLLKEYEDRLAKKHAILVALKAEKDDSTDEVTVVGTGLSGERVCEYMVQDPQVKLGRVCRQLVAQVPNPGGAHIQFVLLGSEAVEAKHEAKAISAFFPELGIIVQLNAEKDDATGRFTLVGTGSSGAKVCEYAVRSPNIKFGKVKRQLVSQVPHRKDQILQFMLPGSEAVEAKHDTVPISALFPDLGPEASQAAVFAPPPRQPEPSSASESGRQQEPSAKSATSPR